MEQQNYEVIRIDEDTWSIEDGFVRFFLLKGNEKALLIDSGMDITGVKELALRILGKEAALPLELLNTHSDRDHCNGNPEFDCFYMHDADRENYERQFGKTDDIVSVKDGDVLDLGGRPLEIIEIPGHTHGSIAILDIERRVLYAGDTVQNGEIFMFGDHRNLDEYPASLMKLQDMEDRFDVIFASHADREIEPDYIGKLFDACESIFHGEVEPAERDMFGIPVNTYVCDAAVFLIDKNRAFTDPDED